MKLTWIDWSIVTGFIGFLALMAWYTRRYTRTVSDFLAADRCAGRYLLTMSEGMAGLGAAAIVANFEKFYTAGFAASWWGMMLAPAGLIIALSGWVLYRYRETRAMTMAQFFEMRYSKRFRIYSGFLAFVSGVLNYGVFPAVMGRFIMHFCGLPESLSLAGLSLPVFPLVMAIMLSIAVSFTLCGGMIAVMITDFFQAQFTNIAFVVMMLVLFLQFGWGDIIATLREAEPGKSLINPFDQGELKDFDFWFFAIFAFKAFYNCLGWQGAQGYNCSAKSPHEAKMARVLGEWRSGVTYLMLMMMPICIYVLMHNNVWVEQAAAVQANVDQISDPQIRKQMLTPIGLAEVLPPGVVGLFCAAMIAAAISTDDTYLHSWGSIFIQDVVMPFRKTPLSQKQHLRLLRWAIVGVSVFAFFFSWFFPLRDYLFMYFLLTGTIYLGGSGAVIIGGLYWRRGTTAGAWWAMTTGLTVAIVGITLQVVWPTVPVLLDITPKFPLNGAWLAMVAYGCSIVAYIGVSLVTCREPFNLEKMLHRGEYAVGNDHAGKPAVGWRALGVSNEFTRGDKVIYYFKLTWTSSWFAIFIVGCTLALTVGLSDEAWAKWWAFKIGLTAVIGVVTIVWFLWGGVIDLRALFRTLRSSHRDTQVTTTPQNTETAEVEQSPVPIKDVVGDTTLTRPMATATHAAKDAAPRLD